MRYPLRRHLTVLDVMNTNVVTANPFDGFKEVAQRMFNTGVSVLPVVDQDGLVVGVISEADILVKESNQAIRRHPVRKHARRDAERAEAVVAAQVMTQPATTIRANQTVADAARVMHKGGFKHLPVVDAENRLLGVVSRHDLIKVFCRSDDAIRDEVIGGVFTNDLMIDTLGVSVTVVDGVVVLSGEIERKTELPIITLLVAAMDGVVAVNNELTYRWDDSHISTAGVTPHGSIAGRF